MGVKPAQQIYEETLADKDVVANASRVVQSASAFVQTVLAQLTAPSNSAAVPFGGNNKLTAQVVIAAINTNVVLRMEGTLDGTNWFNLSNLNTDTIITANGTYAFVWVGVALSVRLVFVSEAGGTAVTVATTMRVSVL